MSHLILLSKVAQLLDLSVTTCIESVCWKPCSFELRLDLRSQDLYVRPAIDRDSVRVRDSGK